LIRFGQDATNRTRERASITLTERTAIILQFGCHASGKTIGVEADTYFRACSNAATDSFGPAVCGVRNENGH
jgi:hypothetical protein